MSSEQNLKEKVVAIEVPDGVSIGDGYDPALENIRERETFRQLLRDAPSIMFSLVVHGAALLLLWVCTLPPIGDSRADLQAIPELSDELDIVDPYVDEPLKDIPLSDPTDSPAADPAIPVPEDNMLAEEPPLPETATVDIANIVAAPQKESTRMGNVDGTPLGGRATRTGSGGQTDASDRAVSMGLRWIAEHQLPNGAWSYTQERSCRKCSDTPIDKYNKSMISATAMALLPMLGAGVTHKSGEERYRRNVRDGLDYIKKNARREVHDGFPVLVLAEQGSHPVMYHHGLATIVLCEAAAMTRDKELDQYAQGAVNYICWAQDPVGGGWRYNPREPGDTSGMGWNLMALKSAQMNYLKVPPQTLGRVRHFLNNVVGAEGGALYGYKNNNPNDGEGIQRNNRGTTSVGLLCQMYLGWKSSDPGLIRGTDYLAEWGPSLDDLYYSYYATQAMHHLGGDKWENWNKKMRDGLVAAQIVTDNHERGSWTFERRGLVGEQSGRLGCTAFAVMILEVYYRHMPIYRPSSTSEPFPLED